MLASSAVPAAISVAADVLNSGSTTARALARLIITRDFHDFGRMPKDAPRATLGRGLGAGDDSSRLPAPGAP
jgi:hypothetical protein